MRRYAQQPGLSERVGNPDFRTEYYIYSRVGSGGMARGGTPFIRRFSHNIWRPIGTKSAHAKITKCTRALVLSVPPHNLYCVGENSIPFVHYDLAAANLAVALSNSV